MGFNQGMKQETKVGKKLSGGLAVLLLIVLLHSCTPAGHSSENQETLSVITKTATAFTAATGIPLETVSVQETAAGVTTRSACSEHEGTLGTYYYDSAVLSEVLEVRVYLPPCYQESAIQYPSIYFFHGSPPNSADWVLLGAVDQMNAGIESGEYPPAILVFPLQPDSIFIWSDGGPESYEEEFFLGLVPFIEAHFRVLSQGSARAIAGISRGGVWALEISMMHPDDFSAVAALSPALQYNDPRPEYDPFNILQSMERSPERMLLQAGDQDWARDETEDLAYALEQAGKSAILSIVPGSHEAPLWSGSMGQVLAYLLQDWEQLY